MGYRRGLAARPPASVWLPYASWKECALCLFGGTPAACARACKCPDLLLEIGQDRYMHVAIRHNGKRDVSESGVRNALFARAGRSEGHLSLFLISLKGRKDPLQAR